MPISQRKLKKIRKTSVLINTENTPQGLHPGIQELVGNESIQQSIRNIHTSMMSDHKLTDFQNITDVYNSC